MVSILSSAVYVYVTQAYLQITYVEPFFDTTSWRSASRTLTRTITCARSCTVRRSRWTAAPTVTCTRQYKRKTILTTSHAFPYIKTRINVIHKEEVWPALLWQVRKLPQGRFLNVFPPPYRSFWCRWRWRLRICRRKHRSWPSRPIRTPLTQRCSRWCFRVVVGTTVNQVML